MILPDLRSMTAKAAPDSIAPSKNLWKISFSYLSGSGCCSQIVCFVSISSSFAADWNGHSFDSHDLYTVPGRPIVVDTASYFQQIDGDLIGDPDNLIAIDLVIGN
jgi:hypothetical protein